MKLPKIVACASLLAVAGHNEVAKAAEPSVDQVKEDLHQAICLQNWHQAEMLASQLMASSTITPEHRQTLVDWRYRFSKYAESNTQFESIPNCEGKATRVAAVTPANTVQIQAEQENRQIQQEAERIKAGLHDAICYQDWNTAADLSSRLMASPGITPEHRQTLVDWRYRFLKYAEANTQFESIPNCEGKATQVAIVNLTNPAQIQQEQEKLRIDQETERIKAGLHEAICQQNWSSASELSSRLIASSAISPEQRQILVDWRYRFLNYTADNIKFTEIPNCQGVATLNHTPVQQNVASVIPSEFSSTY